MRRKPPTHSRTAGDAQLTTFRWWLDAVDTALTVQQKLMRHADIQTTLNFYGDVVTDEMGHAGSKVAELALKSDTRLIPVLANN